MFSLGNFTLLKGATSTVTVDNMGTHKGCLAFDGVQMTFRGTVPLEGCTDPLAVNYEPDYPTGKMKDDGSCLYLGGRGLTSRSWSVMSDTYAKDDWYPQVPGSRDTPVVL